MTRIAFWDVSGGHGTPTLVYHLAHMFADQGRRPLLVDLDPTSRLTSMCVPEDRLIELWQTDRGDTTIAGCVRQLMYSDATPEPEIDELRPGLGLLPGNLSLAVFEEPLAAAWSDAGAPEAIVVSSVIHRATSLAEQAHAADIALMNLGPGLGAINRAALLAADHVITPLAPDLTSYYGLHVLGLALSTWRAAWQARATSPPGQIRPLGYIITTPAIALNRRPQAQRWQAMIPDAFRRARLEPPAPATAPGTDPSTDPWCLGLMRDYPSLRTLAREARRPMFHLRPADGAIGAQMTAVVRCREDFDRLARTILTRAAELSAP